MVPEHNDDAVLRALARLESKMDSLDGKVDSVGREVGHIRERTAVMESKLAGVGTSLDGLTERVHDLEQEKVTQDTIQKLEERVDELEAYRNKQLGIWLAICVLGAILGYIFSLFIH